MIVSIPAVRNAHEGDGQVQVCATLFSQEDIERDFIVTLATSDGTGKHNSRTYSKL